MELASQKVFESSSFAKLRAWRRKGHVLRSEMAGLVEAPFRFDWVQLLPVVA